uniref:Protein kinase domain-containing protein n=1 Tax=Aegilops tauschii subsp. strangulata TaxID=200361 RepID=A0A452XPL4_AEGTS
MRPLLVNRVHLTMPHFQIKSKPNFLLFIDHHLQSALTTEGLSTRRNFIDPAVSKGCSDELMRTVKEICLTEEPTLRPLVEDVFWNLQFAALVQDDWSSEESPLSSSQIRAQSAEY